MASSPAAVPSPSSMADGVLTPSRKVQALLAQFDDSDTDTSSRSPKTAPGGDVGDGSREAQSFSEDTGDEDDQPTARLSRMTARLRGAKATTEPRKHAEPSHDRTSLEQPGRSSPRPAGDSEDELMRPAPERRLLLKRKSSSAAPSSPLNNPSDPSSPLFFPSPGAEPTAPTPVMLSDRNARLETSSQGAGSKFKALVEKHRKARLEKEAAENAKWAAAAKSGQHTDGKSREPRGSSPADDSDEGSDQSNINAAIRLTKDAKPTRKASKKAMEEMKRETQRMSRNMQLAHQAQTKKKITKDSLLARFNFSVPVVNAAIEISGNQSATASSEVGSDAEPPPRHETPPTSPLLDPLEFDKLITASACDDARTRISKAAGLVVEAPPLEGLGLDIPTQTDKGKGKARVWVPLDTVEARRMASELPATRVEHLQEATDGRLNLRTTVSELLKRQHAKYDDDDLEVITKKGAVRKYAAFEQLPNRKAKETQSHLALKSLAHLHDNERNTRSSMTTSAMAESLRKAARMQAREERWHKIAELKAKGVVIQSAEERERDQQEVEDLVERARQEAAKIQKREKELAKKNGTYVREDLDDDDSDDEEFEEDVEEDAEDDSEADSEEAEGDEEDGLGPDDGQLIDDQAGEANSGDEIEPEAQPSSDDDTLEKAVDEIKERQTPALRRPRAARVVFDDEDEPIVHAVVESPVLPQPAKTPQSLPRSARKQIPGLNMSDDLPLGLSQAFAATMADSQTQDEQPTELDSLAVIRDLPSPNLSMVPKFNRLDSLDMISDSQPGTQTQPLNIDLSFSQSQKIPISPYLGGEKGTPQFTPSQAPFEPTQDGGYLFSPFQGSRFAETPRQPVLHSTIDTVIVPDAADASPVLQRKGRLQRGRVQLAESNDEEEGAPGASDSAFEIMRRAIKRSELPTFDKSKSNARGVVDEAAEESDDEYAGLGGASDDDGNDEENEDDRQMIDHDTHVGMGDEAKLAGLFADRERQSDEAAVSKLLKDITTGALRRKRGANDDLDLSDEEDAVARRREAKRREFAKMRRELLKDEAVGKIAEDKKKEAFLKSIEDREAVSDDDDFDEPETPLEGSQEQSQLQPQAESQVIETEGKRTRPLEPTSDAQLNRLSSSLRRTAHKKPSTLAEIRESVSFLIEEADSQANSIDLGLSDSEDEPEAYVDLDRHLQTAEADENAALDEDDEDLDDFIIDDDDSLAKEDSQDSSIFKKPSLPSQTSRTTFADRPTNRANVVNRLSLLRQSSSTSSNSSTKLAFYSTATGNSTSSFKVPSLLRRATTNSSVSSLSSSENVSATGVTTSRPQTERGHASDEKEFIRKGTGGRRNAVNYRPTDKEERMSARAGVQKALKKGGKRGTGTGTGAGAGKNGFLGGLFRGDSWG